MTVIINTTGAVGGLRLTYIDPTLVLSQTVVSTCFYSDAILQPQQAEPCLSTGVCPHSSVCKQGARPGPEPAVCLCLRPWRLLHPPSEAGGVYQRSEVAVISWPRWEPSREVSSVSSPFPMKLLHPSWSTEKTRRDVLFPMFFHHYSSCCLNTVVFIPSIVHM